MSATSLLIGAVSCLRRAAREVGVALPASRPWASWMACHTLHRGGRHVYVRNPEGESASTTAFMTAGGEPMVPASPTPFTPIGFEGDGVTVRSRV